MDKESFKNEQEVYRYMFEEAYNERKREIAKYLQDNSRDLLDHCHSTPQYNPTIVRNNAKMIMQSNIYPTKIDTRCGYKNNDEDKYIFISTIMEKFKLPNEKRSKKRKQEEK
ncbi:hypothetical protein SNEBB_009793 [Seison nebaliae]|nr:hypothetical protein SNEBB_009793 [Seison nebaliae]